MKFEKESKFGGYTMLMLKAEEGDINEIKQLLINDNSIINC